MVGREVTKDGFGDKNYRGNPNLNKYKILFQSRKHLLKSREIKYRKKRGTRFRDPVLRPRPQPPSPYEKRLVVRTKSVTRDPPLNNVSLFFCLCSGENLQTNPVVLYIGPKIPFCNVTESSKTFYKLDIPIKKTNINKVVRFLYSSWY